MYLFAGHTLYVASVTIDDTIRRGRYFVNNQQSYKILGKNGNIIALIHTIYTGWREPTEIWIRYLSSDTYIRIQADVDVVDDKLNINTYILEIDTSDYCVWENDGICLTFNGILILKVLYADFQKLGKWIYRTHCIYSVDMLRFPFMNLHDYRQSISMNYLL